ncbi:MAG: DUF4339 domain-containing protein [Gemmataceae bacterium]
MESGFFVAQNKQKNGPFTWPQLQQMAAAGQLQRPDMILPPGTRQWVPAGSFGALFPASPPETSVPLATPAPAAAEPTVPPIPPVSPLASDETTPASDDPSAELALSASERNALGPLRSFHPTGSRKHKINIAITAGFTLVFGAAAVAALIAWATAGNQWWIGAALFGGLALLPAVGLAFELRKRRWRLFLFEKGFVLVKGCERVVPFTDIQSLIQGGLRIEGPQLKAILQDGGMITLDSSFQDFPSFIDTVRNEVTRLLLEKASLALSKGDAMPFGKWRLSQAGLENDGEALPWSEVHSLGIERRISGNVIYSALIVFKKSPEGKAGKVEWCARRMDRFANVDAFLELASRFTRIETEE